MALYTHTLELRGSIQYCISVAGFVSQICSYFMQQVYAASSVSFTLCSGAATAWRCVKFFDVRLFEGLGFVLV